jgi:hypothetical protein
MDITYVTKEELPGADANTIRNWIADFYHDNDNPPDYLLLIVTW